MQADKRPARDTIQRRLILAALEELDIHATAEQVYGHVCAAYPSISKATVYRNLRQMAESGEIADIGILDGSTHYDHRLHRHYHFVCESCGRIFDVAGNIGELCAAIGETDKHEIRGHSLHFAGLCRDCK